MPGHSFQLRFVLTLLVKGALVAVAALLILADDRWLNLTGTALISGVVIWWLVAPIIDARRMERHVEQNPELLKNEAIGEEVTVLTEFASADGLHKGVVMLHAEKWQAQCAAGPVPLPGDRLIVSGRRGLTLELSSLAARSPLGTSAES